MKRTVIPAILVVLLSLSSCMRGDLYDNDEESSLLDMTGLSGAPKISSITSSAADGAYGETASIEIVLNFNKPVTLAGGTMDVTLDNGAVITIAAFGPASSVSAFYTVGSGDNSPDLNVASIALGSGATLTGDTGENAKLTLPLFSNLRNNTNIVIDTTPPTITSITSSTAPGAYGVGHNISITINFSEVVTLTAGSIDINLDSGGTLSIPVFTPSNRATGTYTVASGNNSADLNVSAIALGGGGTLVDAAGNNADITPPAGSNLADNESIAIDTTIPMITSIDGGADGAFALGQSVNVTVNFNEAVRLTGGSMTLALDSGGAVTIAPFALSATATGVYTVGAGQSSADLNVNTITLAGGAILADTAGNNADLTLPVGANLADNRAISVDGIVPTITSITTVTPDGTYGSGATIDLTITFSEPVFLTGGPITMNLNSGGSAPVLDFALSASASGFYTVSSPQATSDLNVASITIGGAALTDAAGNPVNTALPVGTNLADASDIVIDAVMPSIASITSSTVNGTYGNGATIDVTINFTDNVTLVGGDIQIVLDSGGTVTIPPFGLSSNASGTYTVGAGQSSADLTVSPGGISLTGGTLRDAGGNNADLTIPAGQNLADNKAIVVDSDGGTVTSITSTALNGIYGNGQTVDVVVTFSEPVTLAGNNLLLTLDTGYVVNIAPFTNAATASGTYTISSPESSPDLDVIGIGLAGGATVEDQYGNTTALGLPGGNNLADLKAIVIDAINPGIASIDGGADGAFALGQSVNVTVNFSEAVQLTGGSMTLALDSGGAVTIAPFALSASATGVYTVGAGQSSADLNVNTITLAGGAILADTAGNNADLTLPVGANLADNRAISVDGIVPTITSITTVTPDGTYGSGATIDITINFSEPVYLTGGPISVNLNSGGSAPVLDFALSASASGFYTVSSPQATSDLNVASITIGGAALTDAAGNPVNTALPVGTNLADASDIVIDAVAPSIASISSSTVNGTYGNGATIDVTINFTDNVTLVGGDIQIVLDSGGTVTIPPFGLSSNASGTYTVGAGQSSADLTVSPGGISLTGGTLRDAGGNNADLTIPAGQNLADNKAIVVDSYGGTVTSITSLTPDAVYGSGQVIDVVVNFSEPVTLSGNDLYLTLDTGSIVNIAPFTNAATASGTYTISSPESSPDLDVIGIGLAGGATIEDQFGNTTTLVLPGGNNLADLKNILIDAVQPTITSIVGTDAAHGQGSTVSFTVNFSEPVSMSGGTIWLQLNSGGSAFVAPFANSNTATALYSVGAGENTADLTVNNGGISLTAGTLRDAAGNDTDLGVPIGNNLGDNNTIVIDTLPPAPPVVTAYYSNNPTNNAFAHGTDMITVAFTTSEPLPTPSVLIGGSAATVTDMGGATSWEASYTLIGGESDGAVGYSITLTDLAGNTTNEVNGVVMIDNTAPTIDSVTALESTPGTYYIGGGPGTGHIIVRVNFSDAVTLTGGASKRMEVTLNAGPTLYYNAIGPETNTVSYNYSVVAGNTTNGADLEATGISVFDGQIVDRAGNPLVDFTIGSPVMTGFFVDGVGPNYSAHIESNNSFGGSLYAKVGDTITVTVTPDEPISKPTVSIAGKFEPDITVSPGAGNTWEATYTMQGGDSNGLVTWTVTGVQDVWTNPGLGGPDGSWVDFSKAAPTVLSVTPVGPLSNAQTGDWVWVNVQFSKDMYTSFVPATWPELRGLTTDPYIISDSAYWVDNTNWRARFYFNDENEENLAAVYSIADFPDVMGNVMAPNPTESFTVAVDTRTPTASIAMNYLNKTQYGTPVDVVVQFDTVMDTAWPGWTATLDIPATASVYTLTDNGWTNGDTTWTGRFTFNDPDDADIDATGATIDLTGFRDVATNVMDPLSRGIIVDTRQPTVTSVDSLTADGTYGVGYGVDITVNFSEPVTMAGDDLTVRFAGIPTTANLGQFPLSSSVHATYTVAAGDSTASLNVNSPSGIDPGAGTLRDAAGNDADLAAFPPAGNNLADNTDIVIDGTPPFITNIWSSSASSVFGIGQSVDVTIDFNEAVTLDNGDLLIPLNTGGTAVALYPQSGTSISATYVVGPGESTALLDVTGPITLDGAGTLRDGTGNNADILTLPTAPNRLADNDPITIDGVAPNIADVTVDFEPDGAYTVGYPIDITLHFSEQVTLAGGPITVNFDGGGSMTISNFGPSMSATGIYTVGAGQNSTDLYVSGIVTGGATFTDMAGNAVDIVIPVENNLAYDRAIVIDTWAPTITSVTSLTSPGTYGESATIDITVNYSEPVSLAGNDMAVILNSGSTIPVSPFGLSASTAVNYTVGAGESANPLSVTSITPVGGAVVADAAGNQMVDFGIPTNIDINLIVVDAVPPEIDNLSNPPVTMDVDGDGRIDHYKITFTESVLDSTFPGHNGFANEGNRQDTWLVLGYAENLITGAWIDCTSAVGDVENDKIIYLKFDEVSFPDTGAKPDIQTSAAGGIEDLAGNVLDIINMATATEIDGVPPRIDSIVGVAGEQAVQVTFTEPVDATMGGGCSGTLSISNLTYQNSSGGDASGIMNMTLDNNACDDSTVVIRTNTAVTTNDIDVDGLMPPASVIRDANDNTAMPFVYTLRGLTQSMQLNFDTTSSGADVSTVTNFPLLVRLSDPGIIDAVRDGAPDLRFNDPDGTPLAYQVERWDKTLDAAEVWVLVPTITGNSKADYITMYFDDKTNDTVPGRQEPGRVFGTGNNFAGVWHLAEDSGQAYDSTINKNNSSTNSAVFDTAGYIGNSRQFSSSATYIEIPDTNDTLDGVGTIVVSAWVRHNDGESISTQKVLSKKSSGTAASGWEWYTNTSTEYTDFKANTLSYFRGMPGDIDDTWHHLVMGLQGAGTRVVYMDGATLTPSSTPTPITAGSDPLVIGATAVTHTPYFDGSIDEVRVETGSLRTANWYKLCYENQRIDQTLIKYWYDPNFTYRIKVTVQGAQVAGTVTQFPVYVNLNSMGSNFWNNVTGAGNIAVTAGNGITKLPREVVFFSDGGSTGTGELWFRAPLLDPGKDVSFYIYFGGSGTDGNDSAVWSNGYAGVWHLQNSGADSSPNGNAGTPYNGSFATSAVGNGFLLNGSSSYIDVSSAPSLGLTGQLTISAWFRSSANLAGMTVLSKRTPVLPLGYNMTVDTLNDILDVNTGLVNSPGYATLGAGELSALFYHYAATVDGTTCALYLNGAVRTTDSLVDSLGISGTNLNIGRMTDGTGYFNGALDEVRLSNMARSAAWITTEYNNQYTPGSFYSVSGTLETQ